MSRNLLAHSVRILQVALDAVAGGIMAAITLVVLWGVVTRFALGSASLWTDEAARFLLLWLTMIGAAAAAGRAEHLGVDVFVNQLHPEARRLAVLAAEAATIGFAVIVLVFGGAILVFRTLQAGQVTPAMGLPMGLIYLAAPIAGFGIALFSIDRMIRVPEYASEASD